MHSIFTIILAILGINLLVFIHELGHYIVARKNKMRVEVFSIGFGKPLVSWMHNGVKWQICPIFFGGYVRIAGMDKEGDLEPYEVPEGYYSKKPWARIKVALAGPLVNLVFALLVFTVIWTCGGRQKPFSQFTKLIGYVDPRSELYQNGVRPGDILSEYNHESFKGYQDLLYASLMNGHPANLEGQKIDYFTHTKTPYDYTVTPYESPELPKGMKTIGILAPASYLIYEAPQFENLPLAQSGIEPKDQIVWVNGELIFSSAQLTQILNSGKALLTIERGDQVFLGRVPRIPLDDLRLSADETAEFDDWKYEAGLRNRGESYAFIPYLLSYDLRVEKGLYYINQESKVARATSTLKTSSLDTILRPGDRILAVDGIPVDSPIDFFRELQAPRVQMIVNRSTHSNSVNWSNEDEVFIKGTNWEELLPIVRTIGSKEPLKSNGAFHLLQPVTPIRLKDFPLSPAEREEYEKRLDAERAEIEKIADTDQKEQLIAQLDDSQNRLILGVALSDRFVHYNPNPFVLFGTVFTEIARNLTALFSGSIGAKHFGGPIAIVQIMQHSWSVGIKEALFWLGAISLNLGILNLLPIPVLDGGHICFSLVETVRKKPLKAKTMHRLVIPFVVLLVLLFVYLTYNDLIRIFGRFF